MALRLVGQDCAIQVTLGGLVDGTASFVTPIVLKAFARRIMVDESASETDVSALGDGLDIGRPKRSSAVVEIETLVVDAPVFNEKVGYYAKAEFKELASMASYKTYVGYISKRSLESPDGEQLEKITIKVGVDGYTYTGTYS